MQKDEQASQAALTRFRAQLPLMRVWVGGVVAAHGGSARELVDVGARALWRCCRDFNDADGVPFAEVAELTVTSELLARRHYPVPSEPLPEELSGFRGDLTAMAEELERLHPQPSPLAGQLIPYGGLIRHGGYPPAFPEFYAPAVAAQAGDGQALKQIADLLRRRWPLVLAMIAITEVGVLGFTLKAAKDFKATTTLNTGVSAGNELMGQQADWYRAGTVLANMSEMLQSRTVTEDTIKALGLHTTAKDLMKHISVDKVPQTDLLKISATAPTAQQAADLANTQVQQFIRYYTDLQSGDARTTDSFLADQLQRAKADLDAANARLKAFKLQNIPEAQTAIPTQLADLRSQLQATQQAVIVDQSGLSAVNAQIGALRHDPLLKQSLNDSPDVDAARDHLKMLTQNLEDARSLYGKNSPVVQDLEQQIARARGAVSVTRAHVAQADPGLMDVTARKIALNVQLAQDEAKLALLSKEIGDLTKQAEAASGDTVTYQQLQQDVAIKQATYQQLSDKVNQAGLEVQGAHDLNLNVVDPAIPPSKPESQKTGLKMTLGAIIAAMFGLFAAFLVDRRASQPKAGVQPRTLAERAA